MSTARNRFGVSILVALVLAVALQAAPAQAAAANTPGASALADVRPSGFEGFGTISDLAAATSGRTQFAVALGAGVPMIIIGFMVRRRVYAEV